VESNNQINKLGQRFNSAHLADSENPQKASEKSKFLSFSFRNVSGKIFWFAFLLIVVAVIGYLFFSENGLARNAGLMEKKIMLEADNLRLEEENRQLSARLERIRNDSGYLEDEARKKLGLVRPDEIIFRLAEEPELTDDEVKEQLD
jgi:cell division protein FtsB